jgi:hypothetical protein
MQKTNEQAKYATGPTPSSPSNQHNYPWRSSVHFHGAYRVSRLWDRREKGQEGGGRGGGIGQIENKEYRQPALVERQQQMRTSIPVWHSE